MVGLYAHSLILHECCGDLIMKEIAPEYISHDKKFCVHGPMCNRKIQYIQTLKTYTQASPSKTKLYPSFNRPILA
jgi:hypothetical protein